MANGAADASQHVLSTRSRILSGLAGLGIAGAGIALYVDPPDVERFPPQCGEAACVTSVEEPSEIVTTGMLATGALLFLVAVNGRVVLGLKFGGAEATMAEERVKDEAARAAVVADLALDDNSALNEPDTAPAPGEGDARLITVAGRDLVRVDPAQVPIQVLMDMGAHGAPVSSSADIAWGARQVGQGNQPWYVQLRSGRVFKISYDESGSHGVSVVELPPSRDA
jgi:hypothetical protein